MPEALTTDPWLARECVVRHIWRTGRETFSSGSVNVAHGTLIRLVGNGFIVQSMTEAHKRSTVKVYRLGYRGECYLAKMDD